MSKKREAPAFLVRVGNFIIRVDERQYIVDHMGLPDTSSHLFKGDPNKEIVKRQTYYSSFEALAKGVLENAIKRKFNESGLKGVYNNTLKELIKQCEEKLNEKF